jgi:WD40 repeat protein
MKSLLKRYHFCSFHKDSQHLFVPGNSNEIIIYDLRTAMRWKSLKGHEGLIECIAVQDGGQIVASFSRKDKEIKLWKIHSSGFFENILGNSTQLYRSIRVKEEIPLHAELKLTWINNDKQIELSAPKENFRVVLGGT